MHLTFLLLLCYRTPRVWISNEQSSYYIIPSCPLASAKTNAKEKGSGKRRDCHNFGFWRAGLPKAILLLIHDHFSAKLGALIALMMHYNDL